MIKKNAELVLVSALLALHLFYFRTLLLGITTISHDNISWNYPIFFNYFYELTRGSLPIFNFFSRFGEPFLPAAAQIRLLDPIQTVVGMFFWTVFNDKILAFNWFRYSLCLLNCFGIYLFFRVYTQHLWVKALLISTLLFSSVFVGPFRQDGFLTQFLWVPYLFLLVRDGFISRPGSLLVCWTIGILIGSSFQSYFFIMPNLALILYLGYTRLSGFPILSLADDKWRVRLVMILIPLLPMAVFNFANFLQSKDWVFPARTTRYQFNQNFNPERLDRSEREHRGLLQAADSIATQGSSSEFWDYIQIFSPWANNKLAPFDRYHFGEPSEAVLFIGLLAIVCGFIGMGCFANSEGTVWLNLLAWFFLLGLGSRTGLYTAMAEAVPVFGFVRNTHCFVSYVQFSFMYFLVIGGNRLYEGLMALPARHRA